MSSNHENSLADQDLVKKVLSGDTRAFGVIIKKTERLVAQIAFKMVSDAEERKDIAQDVYLKAFKGLSGFKFQSKLSTWIARIAYNDCLSYLEKQKKDVLIDRLIIHGNDNDADEYLADNATIGSEPDIEISFFQEELSAILKTELEMLPPLYKTLITLYHNEDLSYSEIAEITALPEGTVKNYLFRARKALKKNLLQKYKRESL